MIANNQLSSGRLDDRLLTDQEIWGQLPAPRPQDPSVRVENRVFQLAQFRLPPADALSPDAAQRRLRGSCGEDRAPQRTAGRDFKAYTKFLGNLGEAAQLPKRGDTFPAHWEHLGLPARGSTPVEILQVSTRAAAYLRDWQETLLRADFASAREASGIVAYVDPHFADKEHMMNFAVRFACANMLVAVENAEDNVGLFTAVKKCEMEDGKLDVSLRLVFDQRRSNTGWQPPPWRGLGSLSGLSYFDFSEQLSADGAHMEYTKGDIPSYFYVLGLPSDMASHFCLEGVDANTLRAEIKKRGVPTLLGKGDFVGMRVAPMGWSWAVFLAQTTIEDVFDQGPEKGFDMLCQQTRDTDGGALPVPDPLVHIEYVDDFGIVGCKDGNTNPGELSPVEFARLGARQLLQSAGFDVHKEDFGRSGELIGGQFMDSWLLPHQRKLLSAVALSQAARRASKVPPSFVETIVATFSWYFLIERAALSIFDVVYRFCRENRDKKAMKLPTAVLRELAADEAIVPLLGVNLVNL